MSNYASLKKDELIKLVEKLASEAEELKIESAGRNILSKKLKDANSKIEGLESRLSEQDAVKAELEELREENSKLNRKVEILTVARKEDKEKVEKAENLIAEYSTKEHELSEFYTSQINQMRNMINEQNETIVSLFEMMDGTISLQVNYYQKYKDIFVKVEPKIKLEKDE